jgi:hypothetical protein
VRYRTEGDLRGVVYCHCSQCRRQTGHYLAATDVDDRRIWIEGDENISWYAASEFARRGFCKKCGSLLFWKRNGSDRISVTAGSFHEPTGLREQCHIFVADKGDYYTLDDGLPQFDRSTGSVPTAGE